MFEQRLTVFVRRSLEATTSNPFVSLVSLTGLTVCLFLLGATLDLYREGMQLVPPWTSEGRVAVYLRPEISPDDIESLEEELSRWPEVERVETKSSKEALEHLAGKLGEWKGVLAGMEGDLLPPSLEISLRSKEIKGEELESFLKRIRLLANVEDIGYGDGLTESMRAAFENIAAASLWAIGFLVLGAVLIVSNIVRQAVLARRDELEILHLAGATSAYSKRPFYAAGVLQGYIGGALATGLLMGATATARSHLPSLLGDLFARSNSQLLELTVAMLGCGSLIGWAGSWLVLRQLHNGELR